MGIQYFPEFSRIFKNMNISAAVASDTAHFRVRCIPGNQHRDIHGRFFGYNIVNFFYKRASGVANIASGGGEVIHHRFGNTVCSNRNRHAGRDIFGFFNRGDAPFFQILNHLGIVNDGTQGTHGLALLEQGINHIDSAVNTEAEARCLCHPYVQCFASQSLTISFIMSLEAAFNSLDLPVSVKPNDSYGIGLPKRTVIFEKSFALPSE